MPTDISNLITYINSMSVTLYDKCWWIDKIPENINTVVDFGCAGGDLAIMINRIAPNHYSYIGIDNSPLMLNLANHNFSLHNLSTRFFPNLTTALEYINPKNSILVLNSVVHEIFSYLSKEERLNLFNLFFRNDFAYIAIRDMYPTDDLTGEEEEEWDRIIRTHPKWKDFCKSPVFRKTPSYVQEFLLKYKYDVNWARECNEQYLWNWDLYIKSFFYETIFTNNFFIPFIQDNIKKDFGQSFKKNTHKKVLLRLRTTLT